METGQRKTPSQTQQLLILTTALIFAQFASAADDEPTPGVMLAPSFMAYEVSQEIDHAKSTVIVPVRKTATGLQIFTEKRWADEGQDWEKWMPPALKTADKLAENLDIKWFKDDNGVFLYAAIESTNPLLSSVILSEKFLPQFTKQLGPQILVLAPNRTSLYIFPKFASKLPEYGPAIASRYRDSPSKVSLEILEVSEAGLRVVGNVGQ